MNFLQNIAWIIIYTKESSKGTEVGLWGIFSTQAEANEQLDTLKTTYFNDKNINFTLVKTKLENKIKLYERPNM